MQKKRPNIVFVFADQLRWQACGFSGDPNVKTPYLDQLASQSLNFQNAVSGCPVCSPARASLLTGRYPDQHGIFVNDVCLSDDAVSFAEATKNAGYDTAYIGKWHLDGHGRSAYIPPERRHGFDFWKVLECTHDYNHSPYYEHNDDNKKIWSGYDTIAQTDEAISYINDHAGREKPFLLFLSWGTPHNPYDTAPESYRDMYSSNNIKLRDNVPEEYAECAKKELAGYYAHITAIDDQMGKIMSALDDAKITEDTILVFWSDHGDMLGSQGRQRKQHPFDESIRVPLLIRYPEAMGSGEKRIEAPINTPDLMPTLLDLAGIPVPETVAGESYAPFLLGNGEAPADEALIACYHPFGEWPRSTGGYEYRGIRTKRHTYVRSLDKPVMLYDNESDPFQLRNLVDDPSCQTLQSELDQRLNDLLEKYGDQFLAGDEYISQWGYKTNADGTVPYIS